MAAIRVAGVRGDPCGAVRWTFVQHVKCMCWCLSIMKAIYLLNVSHIQQL